MPCSQAHENLERITFGVQTAVTFDYADSELRRREDQPLQITRPEARLGQLRQRLSKLSQIDVSQIPTDKVGLGSRVVVEDQQTKTHETYSLVFGDSVEFEEGHVSMGSPIGRALVGKGIGDDIVLKLPALTRRLRIVELTTIHQGVVE